jgi:uncharacterized protein YdcH (DUF465 family)
VSNSWEKVFERHNSLEKRVAELEKAVQPEKSVKVGGILKSKNEDILEKLYDVLASNEVTYAETQEILNTLKTNFMLLLS